MKQLTDHKSYKVLYFWKHTIVCELKHENLSTILNIQLKSTTKFNSNCKYSAFIVSEKRLIKLKIIAVQTKIYKILVVKISE